MAINGKIHYYNLLIQLLVLRIQKIKMENDWFYSIKISRKMLFLFTYFQLIYLPYQLNWAPDQKTISNIESVLLLRRAQILWHRKIVYWTLLLFIFLHTYKENSNSIQIHAIWMKKKTVVYVLFSITYIIFSHTYAYHLHIQSRTLSIDWLAYFKSHVMIVNIRWLYLYCLYRKCLWLSFSSLLRFFSFFSLCYCFHYKFHIVLLVIPALLHI